jgi:hypothetical protein
MSTTTDLMRNALYRKNTKAKELVLDGVEGDSMPGASSYAETDIKLKTAAAIQEWTETSDLDEGETLTDRLFALIIGIADANKDGEITDDEQGVLDIALNCAFDCLTDYGVDEEDAGLLLNDWDNDAGDRIRDLVASSLPEGDAAYAEIDSFAFGSSDQEAAFDAVYKKKIVIRNGRKMKINKRISGTVRLSARQKVAIRKAGMKSHSATAMMRRMKSMKLRKRSSLK